MPPSRSVHVPFPRLAEFADLLRARQLDLELMFSAPVLDALKETEVERSLASLEYAPRITLHAPFMDLSPGAVDPMIREVTLQRFRHTARIAREVKARGVVFHSGYEKWKYHLHPEIWLDRSAATWELILDELEGLETCIAIENIFEDTPDNLIELVQRMAHSRFGLCFDTGHFNLFSSLSIEAWLEKTAPHILHLHLHDNDGTADRHHPPGEGTFPFSRLFEWFGPSLPPFTLEAHSEQGILRGLDALDRLFPAAR